MSKSKTISLSMRKLLLAGAITTAAPQPALAEASSIMKVAGRTSQPIGHYEYCQRLELDCRITTRNTQPVRLTQARWRQMVEANARANSLVRPVTDQEFYGTEEFWTLPDLTGSNIAGDCEDYALMKREELMAKGWPASSLLVTVVRQKNGEAHAVLTVRTDRGDFVLDNLNKTILPWNETEYSYLKRVAAAHSGQWETILDNRNVVGSID